MISVTILTKNNIETLPSVLLPLSGFAEVLVVDTGSSDGTVDFAKQWPNVRVISCSFQGFGPLHNFAAEQATHEWILSIDSDEVLSQELAKEIGSLHLNPQCVYSLDRHNFFLQKRMKCCAGWHPDRVVRLYNKKSTRFSDNSVHEKVLHERLRIVPLNAPLLHFPYRSVDHLLEKMQLYTTLFAQQNSCKKSSLSKALWRGFAAFMKSYVLKKGFLGGREGFIISLYNGHTAYYKYLKLAFGVPSQEKLPLSRGKTPL